MSHKCTHAIFDLDGTLLDTESLLLEVSNEVFSKCGGQQLSQEQHMEILGLRPLEACSKLIQMLNLPLTPQQLFDQVEVSYQARFAEVKFLPGVLRLLNHLHKNNVTMAVATNGLRKSFDKKLGHRDGIPGLFKEVVCGDDVQNGKPHPDIYLETAKRLGVKPQECLVFEDAPNGIKAALDSGMKVVAISSRLSKEEFDQYGDELLVLSSMLDFRPEQYGLAQFTDYICDSVPLSPVWYLKGKVVKGFGRGSQQLGIRTANLDSIALQKQLAATVTGIYYGWTTVESFEGVYKMVMSIGWNPFYQNKEKAAEPWILHDFDREFYGDEIKLLVCGYIRPESNFQSLEALIQRIHQDADVARQALDYEVFEKLQNDSFLTTQ